MPCRATCSKIYADSVAVCSLEPAAHAAIAVRQPTTALILFAIAITLDKALTYSPYSVSDEVRIRLKWGQEYTGLLVSVDSYMNIQLSNAEEWIDGKSGGSLGQVLIRCNNVLWISANNKTKKEDVEMS